MKYFLTGATGFIGGRVAQQLRAAGHEVVAVVRTPAKAQDLAALGVQLVPGDLTDKESMRAPMTGVDGVYHIAGWYKVGTRDKSPAFKVNVDGTRHVLELMQELKIPKGVYTSTLAINSNTGGQVVDEHYHFTGLHLSVYDQSKWEAHAVAKTFIQRGLPLVIIMPGLVYGPGDTSSVRTALIKFLKRQLPLAPEQTAFCWAHVDDIARGHILALAKGRVGETYMIGGPRHSFIETLRLCEQISGVPAPSLRAAPGLMKAMSAMMSLIEKIIPLPEDFSAEYLRVNAGVTYWGDDAKARRDLGYNPRPLADGLRETLEHEMQLLGMKKREA